MHPKLADAVTALKETAQFLTQQKSDSNLLSDQHGWNNPAISAHDLAQVPALLAQRLEALDTEPTNGRSGRGHGAVRTGSWVDL
jgi:hypothetical protein